MIFLPYAGMVLHRQNKYIAAFSSADIIDKEYAVTLEVIRIKRDSIFDKIILKICKNIII